MHKDFLYVDVANMIMILIASTALVLFEANFGSTICQRTQSFHMPPSAFGVLTSLQHTSMSQANPDEEMMRDGE